MGLRERIGKLFVPVEPNIDFSRMSDSDLLLVISTESFQKSQPYFNELLLRNEILKKKAINIMTHKSGDNK